MLKQFLGPFHSACFCIGFRVFRFWVHFYVLTLVVQKNCNQDKYIKMNPKLENSKTHAKNVVFNEPKLSVLKAASTLVFFLSL